MTKLQNIGFIGTGIMGKSMLRNLKKLAIPCIAMPVIRKRWQIWLPKGNGSFHHCYCVKACQVMITIVGFPKDVEEVYFAPGAIFDSAAPGTYLVDMTTTSPTLAQKLYAEGKKKGLPVLDAPVTGGDTGAKNGTLSILVGGDKEAYETLLPIFQGMGTNINYMGAAGNGQHAKMANQIMIAGA